MKQSEAHETAINIEKKSQQKRGETRCLRFAVQRWHARERAGGTAIAGQRARERERERGKKCMEEAEEGLGEQEGGRGDIGRPEKPRGAKRNGEKLKEMSAEKVKRGGAGVRSTRPGKKEGEKLSELRREKKTEADLLAHSQPQRLRSRTIS